MPKKRDTSEDQIQEPVRITTTQASILDGLIGMYGPTRGAVMNYLITRELDRMDERRPIKQQLRRVKRRS